VYVLSKEGLSKDILGKYNLIKNHKPIREGLYLGNENDKFYVAKSQEEIYELTALPYYVWLLCDGEHTVGEIAEIMSKDVQVELNEVIEPLIRSIESLSEVGLINLDASAK
jgi:2-keto-3-deoxy-L-rhamnonate aldolase RhmA